MVQGRIYRRSIKVYIHALNFTLEILNNFGLLACSYISNEYTDLHPSGKLDRITSPIYPAIREEMVPNIRFVPTT